MGKNLIYKSNSKSNSKWSFTEKVNVSRSVRQGCPLSMLLYILSLEPLIQKIENNSEIEGLKISNYSKEIKPLEHADDMTAVVKNNTSYNELRKETFQFGYISGSKQQMSL